MSASFALQQLIFETLVADTAVHAFVADRIYDNVPEARAFPYVSFGTADDVDEPIQCFTVEDHFIDIDVWDRSDGKLGTAKKIVSAVKAALHYADLTLPDPYALSQIRVTDTRVFRDPDGKTAHGVVSVIATIETAAL